MATDNTSKNPRKTGTAVNLDAESPTQKRRISDLLPTVNRTDTITKFLDASIDHLFQPPDFRKVSGYIGRKPSYWDPTKDFYLDEVTQTRKDYQVEPAAISKDSQGNITNILFYDDLVNQLRFQGGITNNHNRLFEQKYYSWAPPVDLDKLTAYWNYFWLPAGPIAFVVSEATNVEQDLVGKVYPDSNHPIFGTNGSVPVSSGTRITLLNDDKHYYNNTSFIIEGVGRKIILVNDTYTSTSLWDNPPGPEWDRSSWDGGGKSISEPDYIVMERGAQDGNSWSTENRWFHRDVMIASGITKFSDMADAQATRPIIEFTRDIELYNYSKSNLEPVDLVYEGVDIFNHLHGHHVWTPGNFDDEPSHPPDDWNNGQFGIAKVPPYYDNQGEQRADIDGYTSVRDGTRILVISNINPEVNNKIYKVDLIAATGILSLVEIPTDIVDGSQVSVKYGTTYQGSLFRFDGTQWLEGQRKTTVNQPPLFQLYDIDKVKLDDVGIYPDSNFAGNKIFGYKVNSTGVTDSVLGTPLTYDEFGEINFENFLATNKNTYHDPPLDIPGYYFFRIVGDTSENDIYSNSWNQLSTKTQQYILQEKYFTDSDPWPRSIDLVAYPDPQESTELPNLIVTVDGRRLNSSEYDIDPTYGLTFNDDPGNFVQIQIFNRGFKSDDHVFWEIPLNLQANPIYSEVETISLNQFFNHFQEIINNQQGLVGSAFAINNWRDTAQNRAFGRQIMQHKAPLLKLMILNSTENLDFMLASRFVEREYARTRNKLIQKFAQFQLDQTYYSKSPAQWVADALAAINLGKNNTFPFYYSNMISIGSFIPSTPSALGVYKVYKPEAYLDKSFNVPTLVIKGHDGSQYIMFGQINGGGPTSDPADLTDPRDAAYLELENQIYENIPEGYKSELLLDFNYQANIAGKFRTTDYSREEFLQIIQPMFERWIALKGAGYRENDSYSPDNKFTWNYNSSLDRDGHRVPGNWRGIYKWYFDTDRPNTHPWEMLGFSDKPEWWEEEYGPAPWTGGNTILWQDLEDGYVRQGPRQGYDPLYARPGILNFIPVDPSGNLLDPVACGIISRDPTYNQASADWVFGDIGPIENAWVNSEYYPFAVAQASYLMRPAQFIELGWDPDNWGFLFENTATLQWVNVNTRNRPKYSELYVHGEILPDGDPYIGTGIQQWISDWAISRGQSVTSQFGDIIRGLTVQLSHKVGGFADSTNLRLLTDNFGLVPGEDISITAHLSPSIKECMYSGVIVEWMGTGWSVYGYDVLSPYFNIIAGDPAGKKLTVKVGEPELTNLPPIWRDQVAYSAGDRVRYQAIMYEANADHISSNVFDRNKWRYLGSESPEQGIRVQELTEANVDREVSRVPYGAVFKTQEDVYNFMISYQRWLESEGWIFDEMSNDLNIVSDWRRSGKEFINWSLSSWAIGSFIALSPLANKVKFSTDHGAIQSVDQLIRGVYPLLDKAGSRIVPSKTNVTRFTNAIAIEPVNLSDGIYACRISVKEYEHILTINNTTIFNDLIYDVLYNVRQPRFIINGVITKHWTGRLDAPGFIVNSDQIYPNFEKTATDIEQYFAIEKSSSNASLRDHARHVTGFQFRDYLQALLVDPDVAFQFYQGMIQAKGTPASLGELIKTEQYQDQEKLDYYEEWAFRVGSFGATDIRATIEIQLDRSEIRNNAQLIEFDSTYTYDNPFDKPIQLGTNDHRWLRKPFDINNIWPLRSNYAPDKHDLPTAGFVRIDEVNFYITDSSKLSGLYESLPANPSRTTIWAYDSQNIVSPGKFAVYRITDTGSTAEAVSTGVTTITLNQAPIPSINADLIGVDYLFDNIVDLKSNYDVSKINPGDYILVHAESLSGLDSVGIHQIKRIVSATEFEVDIVIREGFDYAGTENVQPKVYFLQNMHLADLEERTAVKAVLNTSDSPVIAGELVWLDDGRSSEESSDGLEVYWKVLSYSSAEYDTLVRKQPLKVDSKNVVNGVVYNKRTNRIHTFLEAFDPIKGILPGVAEKEIWYKLEYDPAKYTDGDEDIHQIDPEQAWGPNEIGRLWWDISTVKYLDYEIADHVYRDRWWGKIAPGTSVDIYEWVRSPVEPQRYSKLANRQLDPYKGSSTRYTGSVRDAENPAWVVREEFDSRSNQKKTFYYFWAKNVETVPLVPFRKINAVHVTELIANPTRSGINWFCPVSEKGLTLANAEQFLVDEDTVLQINWKQSKRTAAKIEVSSGESSFDLQLAYETRVDDTANVHRQWVLMREGDKNSQPPDEFWRKMRDSLTEFNEETYTITSSEQWQKLIDGVNFETSYVDVDEEIDADNATITIRRPVPDPLLSEVEKYGNLFRPRQNWFTTPDEARRVFIQTANKILLASNIVSSRENWAEMLDLEEPEPDPNGTIYTIDSNGPDDMEYTFPDEVTHASQVTVSTVNDGGLVQGVNYEVELPNTLVILNYGFIEGDVISVAVKPYDYRVSDIAGRNALTGTIEPGQKVFVESVLDYDGKWTLWQYQPTSPPEPSWQLIRTQLYKVSNMWDYVDWYSSEYSADEDITYTYSSMLAFNIAQLLESFLEGDTVKIEDIGDGRWNIFKYIAGSFVKIAEKDGTIQLSDSFYG